MWRYLTKNTFKTLYVIAIIFTVSSCTHTPEKKPAFSIGIATWPGFAPGYIGIKKGFFKDLDVKFYIIDDFNARQAAYVSGKTQATIGTIDSYAFDIAHGISGKLALITDQSNGADGIIVKPSIQAVAQLKSKKIAFTRGSPSHFFLLTLLKENGLTMNDITSVQVDDPGKAGEAFLSGNVDGAVTWEPNITQIVQSGKGKILVDTKSKPGILVDAIEFNDGVLANRKGDIQVFIAGWLKSVEYIKSHPDESYKIMADAMKIPSKEFPNMASEIVYADKALNQNWLLADSGRKAKQLFESASEIWYRQGLINKKVSGSGLIIGDFIK
ncbi:ABC transporter substrate-binding protein [Mucilaginibacter xinganensis]|uniref:NitT/TauT family transport system substrate-binding protein n=1 Tax=Mucilaginibacter xinganensis TaxID=1234841 RepID=A0A223NWM3_9SPHI|nr:ABC transporter substrate-binding protein [Mucilaginibacter xinganensis]ASU34267.1 NitT/TauT family transport system substrate-binding protein [Mucilaginibacter xinganensis]